MTEADSVLCECVVSEGSEVTGDAVKVEDGYVYQISVLIQHSLGMEIIHKDQSVLYIALTT